MQPIDDRWPQWFEAAARPAIDIAIACLYQDVDRQIAARTPTCWLSGKCCDFDAHGHRLYVTALEIAWFLRRMSPRRPVDLKAPCPYQHAKLCTAHAHRPLGCRIYFCQEGTQGWQQDLYEQFQAELRSIHDREGVAYWYLEWRHGLEEAGRWNTQGIVRHAPVDQ